MQRWLLAAKSLTEISTCTSKNLLFKDGYPSADDERVRELVDHFMSIIRGPGPGEKMRTFLGGIKLPIPVTSETNYSRLQLCETLALIYLSLGLNEITPENFQPLFDSVKVDPKTKALYLKLQGLTFPQDGPTKGKFEKGFAHWFEAAGLPKGSAVHAITGRLYQTHAKVDKAESMQSRVSEFATKILEIGTQIAELEEVRAELKDLAAIVHADMRANLASFKLEAEDSDGEMEDGGEDSGEEGEGESESEEAPKRKRQKVQDKEESVQKIDPSSVEAKLGRGLKDSRDERLAPFKGHVAPHILELWYALLFDRTIDAYERMQRAVAPAYSYGAELVLRAGDKYDFVQPSPNAERDTIITQKINCLPEEKKNKMKHEYLKAHDLARSVNRLTQQLTVYLGETLKMSLCLEDKDGTVLCELKEDNLEVVQKAALFNVFMGSIWRATEPSEEDEAEEAESESDSSDEDEEDDEYNGEEGGSSDESDESDNAYDSDDEDEEGEEGSSSGSESED